MQTELRKEVIQEQIKLLERSIVQQEIELEYVNTQVPTIDKDEDEKEFKARLANYKAKVLTPLKEKIKGRKQFLEFLKTCE